VKKRGTTFYFLYFVTFAPKGPEGRKPMRVPTSEGVDDSKEPRPQSVRGTDEDEAAL